MKGKHSVQEVKGQPRTKLKGVFVRDFLSDVHQKMKPFLKTGLFGNRIQVQDVVAIRYTTSSLGNRNIFLG